MKRAPCAGRAFQIDVAAHRSGQPAGDGEAEAGPAGRIVDPLEALENAFLIGLGDARALVGDRHGDLVVEPLDDDRDIAVGGRMANRIAEQD